MRRVFALAVIVTLSGVLPLMASARPCGGKACCRKAASSCCAPSKCMKPSLQDSAPAQANTVVPPAAPQQTPAIVAVVRHADVAAVRPASAPQPIQRRLAALSILLV